MNRTLRSEAQPLCAHARASGASTETATLNKRFLAPELMDDPGLAPALLEGELQALERINWWSHSARILWPSVARLAERLSPRPVRVLDLASGAGDVPIALWKMAGRRGVQLQICGCDVKADAVEYARRRAETAGVEATFFRLDAVNDLLPQEHDLITCSLFLHHLTNEEAGRFLRKTSNAARHTVCINDLLRSRRGLLLAYLGARVLTRSRETHNDAPQSVRAAFTLREMAEVAKQAGLHGYRLVRRFPCRFLFEWEKEA